MSRSSVHRMLGDDFYIGIGTLNGHKLRGLHDPLIEETTFERVQQILAAHRASGDRSHKHEHYLIGRIFVCDACDRRLGYGRHRGRHGGVYEYFSCLSRITRGGRCDDPYLRVGRVEDEVISYHGGLTCGADEQELMREAVRDFVSPRVEQAGKQADLHPRRQRELLAEQKHLVQLSYKRLIDDDVLASEQDRIRTERAQASNWMAVATHEVRGVMEALDDALVLVDETLPYEAADPTLRRILNQATHLRIAPVIDEDDLDRGYRIHGTRDPFYVEADLLVGKVPAEAASRAYGRPQGPGAGARDDVRTLHPRSRP